MEDQTEFLIRWKPDGRILFVNKAYCDYYQVLEKNIIGSNIFDTLTKEEGLRLRTKISGISLSQSTIIDNHPVQRKDGSIAWHQWTDRGIFDQDGKVVEIQSIGFDISDLVETRNKLHLQNLFFEYLFNNAPFAIAFLDNRDHILDVNPAFVRQFSYEKDEVLGKPINSLIIPPGYSEEAEYISGRVVSGFSEDRLTKRMTKDGRLINVKILGRPVVRGGERLGIFAIYQDISESIENEARMKRNEKRLQITLKIAQSPSAGIQELLDYAIQGALDIMECNYGFIYEYKWELNRAEVTAWSESVRRDCPMYVTGEQKIFTPTVIFLKVLSEGKPIICNDVNSTLNPAMPGLHIPIHNYILVPVVYEGHVAAVLGLANRSNGFEDSDAAELTLMMDSVWKTVEKHKVHLQLQEALVKAEESEKLKSSFLAVMSHELRTPLNAIIGFSSLIDESWPLDEIIEYVKTIEASGNHLLSLINDMFHLSALEAGQLQASQEVISLNRLFLDLRDLVLSLQKLDNKPELEIRYVPDPYHPDIEITSDSQKLQEVLINLIRNAIKFTHSGEVEYGFRLTDSELILYVRDTGIGIPEQHSEIIFQKFRQGDEGSSRTHGGLGIGLTLARDLTELLGGKISFQSVVDEGTTFFVKFKAEDLVPSIADIEEVSEKNVSLTGKRILIAEDEDSNFKLLESILMPYKVVIERVFNGEEAVQKIVSGVKPDIILMDLKMPVMDGYEATRRIRMLDPLQPIIAQTAYAMTGDREKALLAGCNDYICKPLNRAHLLEIIQNLLNNRMKTGNSHPSWIND